MFKSGLGFLCRGLEMPFSAPPKSQKGGKFAILEVPKMAFPVPETKIRGHFYRPKDPPNCRKNHLRNAFLYICSEFWAILLILLIFGPFLECKSA